MQLHSSDALQQLTTSGKSFLELFAHGSLRVEMYKPDAVDNQQPHEQDEVYMVVSGSGIFFSGGERVSFQPGDFLFVPAGREHRFENFTDDFATWVIFYGPAGGEQKLQR